MYMYINTHQHTCKLRVYIRNYKHKHIYSPCVYTEMYTTGILYLARRSKYHLSICPLSRGVPRLDDLIFFLVSQFLLQVLSRSFAPLPPFLDFSSFFPHPGRRIFPSLPGFTTHACFLKWCAQCLLSQYSFHEPVLWTSSLTSPGYFSIPSDWCRVPNI